MALRVFCQSPEPQFEPAKLLQQARRFFELEVDVLAHTRPSTETEVLSLGAASARLAVNHTYRLLARRATSDDHYDADVAEAAGRASGMAELARRCPTIWEVNAEAAEVSEALSYSLAALLASVALGPVLPPDRSTLLGVRSSHERVERMLARAKAP